MIFETTHQVDVEDVRVNNEVTNRALLAMLENVACLHADSVGFGILNMNETRSAWILLDWKIEVLKRSKYGEILKIKTWSRDYDKITAHRDFEIINAENERILIGTSRWLFMNIDTWRPMRVTNENISRYEPEVDRKVFKDESTKMKEPDEFDFETNYKVLRRDIDLNNHVHNLNYLDIAYDILPTEEYENGEFNNVIIEYKKEIKYGADVKVYYAKKDGKNIVVLKTVDNISGTSKTNAVITLF